MSVAQSDTYQDLFSKVLDVNPETQRLKEICRVFMDLEYEDRESLTSLAFTPSQDTSSPLPSYQVTDKLGDDELSDDYAIGNMSNLRDFPKLLKKQFLMPDAIFYHRLVRHDLFVMKNEGRQRLMSWDDHLQEQSQLNEHKIHLRQRTYILMDVSASTAVANRLTIEKAIAIAYLESHQKEGGEVWLRTFNQKCGPPWLAKDGVAYRRLINKGVVSATPIGQTDLQGAIKTAFDDLDQQPSEDQAEILLLTDGLAPLELETLDEGLARHKVHIVLVGGERPDLSESELRDHFMESHSSLKQEMENHPEKELRERLRSRLDQMYLQRRPKLQNELMDHWEDDLKSCASKSGGLFLHIPDLPPSSFSVEAQLKDLEDRLQQLDQLLKGTVTTSLEKEKIIDEVLSIRAYALELKGKTNDHERVDALLHSTGEITLGSKELETMLEHAQIRWKASMGQGEESVDFLLFLKVIRKSIARWIKGKENS